MRVKCLAQEHNTMSPASARTRTARSGVERTNHEATAPPTQLLGKLNIVVSEIDGHFKFTENTETSGKENSTWTESDCFQTPISMSSVMISKNLSVVRCSERLQLTSIHLIPHFHFHVTSILYVQSVYLKCHVNVAINMLLWIRSSFLVFLEHKYNQQFKNNFHLYYKEIANLSNLPHLDPFCLKSRSFDCYFYASSKIEIGTSNTTVVSLTTHFGAC